MFTKVRPQSVKIPRFRDVRSGISLGISRVRNSRPEMGGGTRLALLDMNLEESHVTLVAVAYPDRAL